jgi:subtilase family serine protease
MKSLFAIFVVILLVVMPMGSIYSAVAMTAIPTDNSVTPLPGYVLNGQAPGDLSVLVNLAIPIRNADTLGSLLKQVSDPSSSLYKHYLTSTQIEQQFLPTTEYTSMLILLHNMGLNVLTSYMNSIVVVQATASQVKEYFSASIDIYTNGSDSYYMSSGNSLFNGAHLIASNVTGLMAQPRYTNLAATQQSTNITYTEGGFSAKELQNVYNATSLYAQGIQGDGQTVGILDFFGSPTITQDLSLFDKTFGFPDPSFAISPLTPYNPNLGVSNGWDTEVALDVEMAHAMAPRAAINMYVTTGALPFAADIAAIVDDDIITTLSMSFSIGPEWLFSEVGGQLFYFNVFLTDIYFMIGSLQGITFLCSSGDAGGCGYSSGPAGNLGYPDDSPYVTSVGGTQTYINTQSNGTKTCVQTAWSSPGYVPNGANAGGSGGGVSFLEPKPWYQQSQQTPPSYPNGRMEPDVSLQGGIDPGLFVVNSGSLLVVGGTSASVQILSGLLTLIAQSSGGPLGLLNPFLYSIGNDANSYNKAYTPITFGYNIPWTTSFGYNLVTGWGAPNIGTLSRLYNAQLTQTSLEIYVDYSNSSDQSQLELTPNQVINVTAYIYRGNNVVTSGNFSSKLITLTGTSLVTPLTFNNSVGTWQAAFVMGQQSGIAYIDVSGTSVGLSGEGFAPMFAGYLATFFSPTPTNPWITANGGLQVIAQASDLDGNPAPSSNITMQVASYSILNNSYNTFDSVNLVPTNLTNYENVAVANLASPYIAGPIALILRGSTYGFLPFINGIYLQTSIITPEVAVEPAVIGPGQSLTIVTSPVAPFNIQNIFSLDSGNTVGSDVATGSSVTAYLVNASGSTLSSSALIYQSSRISGSLQVPLSTPPGLYTIILRASYGSLTLGYTLGGSFYSNVWVSNGTITPTITLQPSTLFMGQTAQIIADIRYPNGLEVTQGEYTTLVYPQGMQNSFMSIMYKEYQNFALTPLSYNSTLDRWTGYITLPSPYNTGTLSSISDNSFTCSGPYDAYVTGISYDGVPTTTAPSAQKSFTIQPFIYVSNPLITSFQQNWGLALNGVNISVSTTLTGDLFLGLNTLQSGNVVISDSTINGTLNVNNSNLTLQGVHGGNIVATNSSINMLNTDLSSITLINSHLSMTSSSYQTIDPALPSIQIVSPQNGGSYKGDLNVTITISGNNINAVTTYLNDKTIRTFTNNGTLSFIIPTTNYPDGTYTLKAVATQTDGMTSNANSTIFLQNQLGTTQSTIDSLSSGQSNLQNQINNQGTNLNNLSSGQSSLQSQLGSLGNSQTSLNSAQLSLQNQTNNLNSSLNNLNSSQSLLQNKLGDLGNNLTSSMDQMQKQIKDLKESLNTAEIAVIAGIGIGIAGIALAVGVAIKKRSKN